MAGDERRGNKTSWVIHVVYSCCIVIVIVIAGIIIYKMNIAGKKDINVTVDEVIENVATIILSITCSILASIIYAKIMDSNSKEEKDILKKDIKNIIEEIYNEKVNDGIERIATRVSEIYNDKTDMMPSDYYRSADYPHYEFNNYLNKKIIESKKFVYYGESPRFTCKRLYQLKDRRRSNLKIEIFIVNPVCNKVFECNKAFLRVKEQNRNYGDEKKLESIIKQEKLKILYCLYALIRIRDFYGEMDIYLIDDVPFIDIEMTDNTIVLEFFRTQSDYKRYPLTIIYDNKRIYYESYEFYLQWEKEKADHIKGEELTQQYILTLGQNAGIKDLTVEKLEEYCEKEIFKDSEQYIY